MKSLLALFLLPLFFFGCGQSSSKKIDLGDRTVMQSQVYRCDCTCAEFKASVDRNGKYNFSNCVEWNGKSEADLISK